MHRFDLVLVALPPSCGGDAVRGLCLALPCAVVSPGACCGTKLCLRAIFFSLFFIPRYTEVDFPLNFAKNGEFFVLHCVAVTPGACVVAESSLRDNSHVLSCTAVTSIDVLSHSMHFSGGGSVGASVALKSAVSHSVFAPSRVTVEGATFPSCPGAFVCPAAGTVPSTGAPGVTGELKCLVASQKQLPALVPPIISARYVPEDSLGGAAAAAAAAGALTEGREDATMSLSEDVDVASGPAP